MPVSIHRFLLDVKYTENIKCRGSRLIDAFPEGKEKNGTLQLDSTTVPWLGLSWFQTLIAGLFMFNNCLSSNLFFFFVSEINMFLEIHEREEYLITEQN